MTLATLIALAKIYGTNAVIWVTANAYWLIPLGTEAIDIIKKMFG